MMSGNQLALWCGGAFVALALILLLRRPLSALLRLVCRSAVGAAALALLAPVGGAVGLHLGVNLCNALVLGVLGVPGFGLLMMLNWLTQV